LDGVEVQTITLPQKRAILLDGVELARGRDIIAELKIQTAALEREAASLRDGLAKADARDQARLQQLETLTLEVRQTRALLEKALVQARKGRLTAFLDKPLVSVCLKLAPLIVGAVLAR